MLDKLRLLWIKLRGRKRRKGRRRATKAQIEAILELRARGLSADSIAKRLNLDLATVYRTLRRHPLDQSSPDNLKDSLRSLREAAQQFRSLKKFFEEVGSSLEGEKRSAWEKMLETYGPYVALLILQQLSAVKSNNLAAPAVPPVPTPPATNNMPAATPPELLNAPKNADLSQVLAVVSSNPPEQAAQILWQWGVADPKLRAGLELLSTLPSEAVEIYLDQLKSLGPSGAELAEWFRAHPTYLPQLISALKLVTSH